jgi:hypothetical protein
LDLFLFHFKKYFSLKFVQNIYSKFLMIFLCLKTCVC